MKSEFMPIYGDILLESTFQMWCFWRGETQTKEIKVCRLVCWLKRRYIKKQPHWGSSPKVAVLSEYQIRKHLLIWSIARDLTRLNFDILIDCGKIRPPIVKRWLPCGFLLLPTPSIQRHATKMYTSQAHRAATALYSIIWWVALRHEKAGLQIQD